VDALNKFYPKVQPILTAFFRANHKVLPVSTQNAIQGLFNEVMMKVAEIYQKEILRDKFNLDLDLTRYPQWDEKPGQSFIHKFNPCAVCGQVRVVHQCHIIPRNYGGADKVDNYIMLCANHHHLFDRHKLTSEEWTKIDWSEKSEEVQKYVAKVRLPRQQMFWKYRASSIAGCRCGSTNFDISFREDEGNGHYTPASLSKILTCKSCGDDYCEGNYYGQELEWWWEYVKSKYMNGSKPKADYSGDS